MPAIRVISPGELQGAGEAGPFPIESYALRFLAQGDSWFSIGAMPPMGTTNLFDGMKLAKRAVAVNCARPGAELVHMTDSTTNQTFLNLLNGPTARQWDALLLSGLGNDVISAAQSPATAPAAKRLLATPAEWSGASPGCYISDAGWKTFEAHARQVFKLLVQARDRSGLNQGIPIVVHTYDVVVPRDAGAGAGRGPWLHPAMLAYGIPQGDWAALGAELMRRLRDLIQSVAGSDGTLRVVDTQGTLVPATATDTGSTQHWKNEIHPSRAGYRALSAKWGAALDQWF